MRSLHDLTDHDLAARLTDAAAQERTQLATVLAYMAEFDGRKLYLPAGYASMFEYCIQVLRFAEEVAYKRIRVLRAMRRFPVLLRAIADGRLNLTAIVLLKPHLMRENVHELVAAASHKTKAQVQDLIAERFPRLDTPTQIVSSSPTVTCDLQLDPDPVGGATVAPVPSGNPAVSEAQTPPSRVEPLAPERFALQVTIDRATHDKLERARELLSHALPSGDVAQVLDRALDLLMSWRTR